MDAHQPHTITGLSPAHPDEPGADDLSLDWEIQRALLVEPSPDFVARIRPAVCEARRPTGLGWWWRIGIAAVATSALLIAVTMRETSPSIAPGDDQPLAAAASRVSEHVDRVAAHLPQLLIAPEERAGWRLLMEMVSDPQRLPHFDMDEATLDPLTPPVDLSSGPLVVEPIVLTQ
jgi:hypothetical protein